MRILHVTETFATGVARAALELAAASPENTHYLLYSGWEQVPVDGPFVDIFQLPAGGRARIKAVERTALALGAEVVHLHSSWAGVYGRARKISARVAYQPHCYAFEDVTRPRWQRAAFWTVERALAGRTDVVIAVSERERRLARRVAPRAEVVIVPNRSALATVDPVRRASELPALVAMAGEVRPQKDPEMFAMVASIAAERGLPLQFVWIGDGPQEHRVALDESGVTVTGWLPQDELCGWLDRAAVYLHTARYEGFPISVLDAAARAVPLLIRRSPAFEGLDLATFDTVEGAVAALAAWIAGDDAAMAGGVAEVRQAFDARTTGAALGAAYVGEPSASVSAGPRP